MKIFKKDGKINFVDDKNCFVGFDYYSCCCENFGYCITKKVPKSICNKEWEYILENQDNIQFEGYNFDKKFFLDTLEDTSALDGGGVAVFRLRKFRQPSIYLTLYNSHNGYYSHGFTVEHNGIKVKEGSL